MADDARQAELRADITRTIRNRIYSRPVWTSERLADALLPVVSAWAEQDREQYAARRAAEAVRWLARSWEGTPSRAAAADSLRRFADTLAICDGPAMASFAAALGEPRCWDDEPGCHCGGYNPPATEEQS